jgi:hypothetical protein
MIPANVFTDERKTFTLSLTATIYNTCEFISSRFLVQKIPSLQKTSEHSEIPFTVIMEMYKCIVMLTV